MFFLLEFVARIEPSLASDQIAIWYDLTNSEFGTLSSIFFWIYAPMQLIVGLVLDRYGPRQFVIAAILVMSLGVTLFALTDSIVIAGLGRFLTGLGASFGFVSGLCVVNHWFAPSRFAFLSGTVNAVGMVGAAIGGVALTNAIQTAGWRPTFFATALAGIILCVVAAAFLRNANNQPKAHPSFMAPLRIVVFDRRIWWLSIMCGLYYVPIGVFGGLWGNAELMAKHGFSPIGAASAISMIFWGLALGSVAAGWLSDRVGHRKWIIVSNAALAAIAFSAAIYSSSTSVAFIAFMLFLGGMLSGAQMLTFAMAKEGQPKAISGAVIAFVNMIGVSGALIFQPLIGKLIDMSGGAFGTALLTVPACLLASAVMAMFVTEKRHKDHIDT